MRIVRLEEIKEELQRHIRSQELFPIIGSGFTKGCATYSGDEQGVPSGAQMKEYMANYLTEHGHPVSKDLTFSKLARYYEQLVDENDYWQYFRDHFTRVKLDSLRQSFLGIDWKFIYTLNLDDGIEENSRYKTKVLPNRKLRLDALSGEKCVFKLHGDAAEIVKYREQSGGILSITDYVTSLATSESMLEKLTVDLNYSNTLFIGCSLEDELDLLSVAQQLKKKADTQKNRYFVLSSAPTRFQTIDLEDYGIDTLIVVDSYSTFYDQFIRLAEECKYVAQDELEAYRNPALAGADPSKSVEYLISGRFLFDKKSRAVRFPKFYIERELEGNILRDMASFPLQIVLGSRVSGKSYLLAGLLRKIKNRDIYYFDSRCFVDERLLRKLLAKTHSVLLFDTNVLDREATRALLNVETDTLLTQDVNVVLCVHSSDNDVLRIIRSRKEAFETPHGLRRYNLNKRFSCADPSSAEKKETEQISEKLKLEGITPFTKNNTILDNLIKIQKELRSKAPTKFDKPLNVAVDDVEKMSLLIILALNEKITAKELVQCGLIQKNAELLKELRITIEEDHCDLLSMHSIDLVSYQIVCNAKVWLLSQLRDLTGTGRYDDTIVEAFNRIVQAYLDGTKRYKLVEDFVKFDKLNEIFPTGKRLIVKIYDGLRPLLIDSYQYYHQCAKCHSWGMSKARYDKAELEAARIAGLTALHMVSEFDVVNEIIHQMAYAHILNTISIIYAKLCFMENFSAKETIGQTAEYLSRAMDCPENYQAMQQAKAGNGRAKDEEGGVLKKWVERLTFDPSLLPDFSRGYFNRILSYWRSI